MLLLVIFLGLAGQAAAQEKGDGAQSLLRAHLLQAEEITDSGEGDDSLQSFHEEIRRALEQWKARVGALPDSSGLLTGLSRELEETELWADDQEKIALLLKEGASLPRLLALAHWRNRSIRAARDRLEASLNQLGQAGYLEDLLVRYRAFTRELDTRVGPAKHKEPLKKTFPSPAALSLKSRIAQAQIEIAWQDYESALREALNALTRTYFDLQYNDRAVEVLLESRELFRRMEQIALAQLRVGRASQADALRSQALLDILDTDLENLREQRYAVVSEGNASLDLPEGTLWGRVPPLHLHDPRLGFDEALARALRANQRLERKRRQIDMREAALRLAEIDLNPLPASAASRLDPNQGAEAGPRRSPAAAFPTRSQPGRGSAAYGPNAAYLLELRKRLEASKHSLQALENEVEAEVRQRLSEASQDGRRHETYENLVVPKNERAFQTMRGRYNTGSAPFVEFLDAGREFLDASLENEKALRDHNQSLTRLLDVLGVTAAELLEQP